MPASIKIRKASLHEQHDAYALLKIAARRLHAQSIDQWQYWLDPPPYKIKWLEVGFVNGEYYFIEDQSRIIGMYRLSDTDLDYWGQRSDTAYYIHSLVIIPEYSGQGLGYDILRHITDLAKNNDIPLLRLDCHAGNAKLCAFYEAFGFVKVGKKEMPHSLNYLFELKVKG